MGKKVFLSILVSVLLFGSFKPNYQTISFTGDKEIIYDRIKTRAAKKGTEEGRTLEQYIQSEFKPHKIALYEKATFSIDTSKLSIGDVVKKIFEILHEYPMLFMEKI